MRFYLGIRQENIEKFMSNVFSALLNFIVQIRHYSNLT